jgi:hypothetical protein
MAGLSMFWALISFAALRWLSSITDWALFGPMDWLCVLLLAIHLVLILTTLWIWLHPKPEVLVVNTAAEKSNRLFPSGFLIGMAGIWLAARSSGWLLALAVLATTLGLVAALVGLSREIRAGRNLAGRILDERDDTSS